MSNASESPPFLNTNVLPNISLLLLPPGSQSWSGLSGNLSWESQQLVMGSQKCSVCVHLQGGRGPDVILLPGTGSVMGVHNAPWVSQPFIPSAFLAAWLHSSTFVASTCSTGRCAHPVLGMPAIVPRVLPISRNQLFTSLLKMLLKILFMMHLVFWFSEYDPLTPF